MPKKQRHTAKRIFERLIEEGYTGGYTVVKEVVAEIASEEEIKPEPVARTINEKIADFYGVRQIDEAVTFVSHG